MRSRSISLRFGVAVLTVCGSLLAHGGVAEADESLGEKLGRVVAHRDAIVAEVQAIGAKDMIVNEVLLPLTQELTEAEKQVREVEEASRIEAERLANEPPRLTHEPVPGGRLSSPFGLRDGEMHEGIDIAAEMYTPVVAAAAGTVVVAGHPYRAQGDNAAVVIIDHGRELSTLYGHLDDRAMPWVVRVGQHVEAGEVIGYVGMSGRSTGPHLHFMTIYRGAAIDPSSLLPR